jgi:hypothetical protein
MFPFATGEFTLLLKLFTLRKIFIAFANFLYISSFYNSIFIILTGVLTSLVSICGSTLVFLSAIDAAELLQLFQN